MQPYVIAISAFISGLSEGYKSDKSLNLNKPIQHYNLNCVKIMEIKGRRHMQIEPPADKKQRVTFTCIHIVV